MVRPANWNVMISFTWMRSNCVLICPTISALSCLALSLISDANGVLKNSGSHSSFTWPQHKLNIYLHFFLLHLLLTRYDIFLCKTIKTAHITYETGPSASYCRLITFVAFCTASLFWLLFERPRMKLIKSDTLRTKKLCVRRSVGLLKTEWRNFQGLTVVEKPGKCLNLKKDYEAPEGPGIFFCLGWQ